MVLALFKAFGEMRYIEKCKVCGLLLLGKPIAPVLDNIEVLAVVGKTDSLVYAVFRICSATIDIGHRTEKIVER